MANTARLKHYQVLKKLKERQRPRIDPDVGKKKAFFLDEPQKTKQKPYSFVENKKLPISSAAVKTQKEPQRRDGTKAKSYSQPVPFLTQTEKIAQITDPYKRQRELAKFYKEEGLLFDYQKFPSDVDSELETLLARQQQDKSLLERDILRQEREARTQFKSTTEAGRAMFAQSREGVITSSKEELPKVIESRMRKQLDGQLNQLKQRTRNLNRMIIDQQRNWIQGRDSTIAQERQGIAEMELALREQQSQNKTDMMEMIKFAADNEVLGNLDMQTVSRLESTFPEFRGVISAAVEGARDKALTGKQRTELENLNSFKELVIDGTPLSDNSLIRIATETGMPLQTILDFNIHAREIRENKKFDQFEKTLKIKQLIGEIDRERRGVTTDGAKKYEFLKNLYQTGASDEEIALAKKAMGIKDVDDPVYLLELQEKQLQNKILQIGIEYLPGEKITELESKILSNTQTAIDNVIKTAIAKNAPASELLNLQKLKLEVMENQADLDKLMGIDRNFSVHVSGQFLNAKETQGFNTLINYKIPGTRKSRHDGLDFVLPGGKTAKVNAPVSGMITSIGHDAGKKTGWGNTVVWVDNEGLEHRVGHLDDINPKLAVDQAIIAGQFLGHQGNTGFTLGPTGIHVDYRIKKNGKFIDPHKFLTERGEKTQKDIFKEPEKRMAFLRDIRKDWSTTKVAATAKLALSGKKRFDFTYKRAKEIFEGLSEVDQAIGIAGPAVDALIVQFNKMLDPGSVVRESEFGRSEDSVPVALKLELQSFVDKYGRGSRVPWKVVKEIKKVVDQFGKAYKEDIKNEARPYIKQLDMAGINEENRDTVFSPEILKIIEKDIPQTSTFDKISEIRRKWGSPNTPILQKFGYE